MYNLTYETLSIEDWIAVEDCPCQRDTERHAKKAIKDHLKESSPTHLRVSAARLPNGDIYKLDGHTRAYLWREGLLEPVSRKVNVDMYLCNSLEEVERLYRQFDAIGQTETASDKLSGAFKLHQFFPKSTLLKASGFTSSVSLFYNLNTRTLKLDIYKAIEPLIPTLNIIDKRMFTKNRFNAGLLAAMLFTVFKYGESAMPFWERYSRDEGVKSGNKKDGVQALTEVVLSMRSKGRVGGEGSTHELCAKAITAFMSDYSGRKYLTLVKSSDLSKFKDHPTFQKLKDVNNAR